MARKKILIADDAAMNRALLRKMVEEYYEVIEATNGVEALAILKSEENGISAILLDIHMPEMDGYEFLNIIRYDAKYRDLPVIAITGETKENAEIDALNCGATDFIEKPYQPEVICRRLQNSIRLHEASMAITAAQRDNLTGLYTRDAFFERVAEIISNAVAGSYVMACFDIDNFKVINDLYGTAKGDDILIYISQTFKKHFPALDSICCHVVADTFVVLYPRFILNGDELDAIREEILQYDGSINHFFAFSIGRYIIDDLSIPIQAMYDRAVLAMKSVKGRFDAHIAFYDEAMRLQVLREQSILNDMSSALDSGQFEVWLQPQFNHSTGAVIGAEGLVRWRHPKEGFIPPSVFIPVFERNGFIYEMDKYVWEQICIMLRAWIDRGEKVLPISVNVSRYDMFRDDFFETITGLIERYDLPLDLFRIEITESAFADSTSRIKTMVDQLVSYGFMIEIDDFGSGYSSLNTLKDVPAHVLKLDMKFIEGAENTQRGGNILESVIRMAKWLDMPVIAEGVELLEQADYLRSIGCDYIQGYLYSRPVPEEEYLHITQELPYEFELVGLQTVENLDNNTFWDPLSIETLIFNSFVGGACIFEYHDGKIELLRANEKYVQALGANESTTIGDVAKITWQDYLDEKYRAALQTNLKRAVESNDEVTGEYLFQNLPGCAKRTYLRSTFRVIAAAGEHYLIYCLNENVSAQHEAEEKVFETSERLQTIMDNVNNGICAVVFKDEALHYAFSNNRFYELLGYTRRQFLDEVGDTFNFIVPQDRASAKLRFSMVNWTGMPETIEFRIIKRDSTIAWVRCFITLTQFAGLDEPVQLIIYNDITAEHEAIAALCQREEEYRFAIESAGQHIIKYSYEENAIEVSPETAEIFGIPEYIDDIPYGLLDKGMVAPASTEDFFVFFKGIQNGEVTGLAQVELKHADNTHALYTIRFSTIYDAFGKPFSSMVLLGQVSA